MTIIHAWAIKLLGSLIVIVGAFFTAGFSVRLIIWLAEWIISGLIAAFGLMDLVKEFVDWKREGETVTPRLKDKKGGGDE